MASVTLPVKTVLKECVKGKTRHSPGVPQGGSWSLARRSEGPGMFIFPLCPTYSPHFAMFHQEVTMVIQSWMKIMFLKFWYCNRITTFLSSPFSFQAFHCICSFPSFKSMAYFTMVITCIYVYNVTWMYASRVDHLLLDYQLVCSSLGKSMPPIPA